MATQAAQPENHCPLTTTLGVSPWIRKPRPGDCQRWKGLQGAFGGHFRWTGSLLGGGRGPELGTTFTLRAPRHSRAASL